MLDKFLLPGMKTCTAKITPVSEHPLPMWDAGAGAGGGQRETGQ
jgi:hypothetical protein